MITFLKWPCDIGNNDPALRFALAMKRKWRKRNDGACCSTSQEPLKIIMHGMNIDVSLKGASPDISHSSTAEAGKPYRCCVRFVSYVLAFTKIMWTLLYMPPELKMRLTRTIREDIRFLSYKSFQALAVEVYKISRIEYINALHASEILRA
jgi:hypothetical protein